MGTLSRQPEPSPMPEDLTGRNIGRFTIRSRLGTGGMGEVYRAEDTRLKRVVALKRLSAPLRCDPRYRQRLLIEAERASALSFQHIAGVFDVVEEGDELFLVMEYVEGATLRQRLNKPLSLRDFLQIAVQCTEALVAAHSKSVIHSDIKPENIMVATDGQVKVLDFGLAKRLPVVDAEAMTASLDSNQTGPAGTTGYCAPEALLCKDVDGRADIFSLGVVFYEMLTGRHPFWDGSRIAAIARTLRDEPPPIRQANREVSAELERIIFKMLAKDREERFATAADLLVDLKNYQHALSAQGPGPRREPRQLTSRRVILSALAGLVVLLALGVGLRHALLRTPPAAEHSRLLITNFDNRTGEVVFDQTLGELLTTALEQSPYLGVFPSSGLQDALHRMERTEGSRIDEELGHEIAQREGLQAVIAGSISRLGSSYVLVVRVTSPLGDNLVSAEASVSEASQVPSAVDSIAKKLRAGLGESLSSVEKASLPLAQVTSRSLEAVRYYSLGKQSLYANDLKGAVVFFRKAIDLDTDFAMAHEYLGIAYWHMNDESRAREQLELALRLSGHVTEWERHKIQGDYAALIWDHDSEIEHFKMLTQLRPGDAAAHLNLGFAYAAKFQYDNAIAETAEAVRLQPDSGPRGNLARAYFAKSDTQRAFNLVQELLLTYPGNFPAQEILARCLLMTNREEEAKQTVGPWLGKGGNEESRSRSFLADIAFSQGSYLEATRHLEVGRAVDQSMGNVYAEAGKRIVLGELALAQGRSRQLELILKGIPSNSHDAAALMLTGRLYARAGRLDMARNQLRVLNSELRSRPVPALYSLSQLLDAEISMAQGKPQAAVDAAEQAVRYERSTLAVETMARAYSAADRPRDAIREYENVLARGNERLDSYDGPAFHDLVLDHYLLGVEYQEIGENGAASRHLQAFLQHWRQPDDSGGIYSDAKRRLKEIEGVPSRAALKPTPAT